MVKRVVAGVLWFYAVASVWNGLAMGSGVPVAAGFVLGALVAVFVWADPLHLLTPPASGREARATEHPAGVGALDRGA